MREKSDTAGPWVVVARLAARQYGVVTSLQLREAGLGKNAITKAVRGGQLHRIHQSVYAVGHRGLSLHGRFMAAVLACGEGAVLSHGSAAVLWKLLKPLEGPIHVSVPTTSGRKSRRGIHLHRAQALAEPSPSPSFLLQVGGRRGRLLTTRRDNIPVTTVSRTIEDLRHSEFPTRLLRRATRQAELMGLRLARIESDRTRSDLESLFLDLCRRYDIPLPGST